MLHTLTITEAQKKLQSKEISAEELTASCINQIKKEDSALNAVVFENFEDALLKAKDADNKADFSHPLAGIPFLTKDVFCEKGVQTTAASNILREKNYTPTHESTTTKRLKGAGAISIGKANTDEFTMGSSTETSAYGVSKNPHDHSRVAGGSSGGSAAAVSANECIFALGTDTGGSIRQPASFCGCVGMRVTYGRTSRYGVMSMASSLDSIGALTKTVEDTALVLETIAGKDPLDATSGDVKVPTYSKSLKADIKGMKFGLPKEYFVDELNEEIKQSVLDASKKLASLGAEIEEISLPHTKYAVPTYYILCPCEVSSNMARFDGIRFGHTEDDAEDLVDYYHNVRTAGFGDEVKRRIMLGTYALSAGYYEAYYRKAQKVRTLIKKDFEDAFTKVDAIIAPVAPSTAFKIGAHTDDPVAMYLEDIFTVPQALAGIPCMSVPCGNDKQGLPIGLQIMGPQWHEERVLQIGYAYEQGH